MLRQMRIIYKAGTKVRQKQKGRLDRQSTFGGGVIIWPVIAGARLLARHFRR